MLIHFSAVLVSYSHRGHIKSSVLWLSHSRFLYHAYYHYVFLVPCYLSNPSHNHHIYLLISHEPTSSRGAHICNCIYHNLKLVDVKPHLLLQLRYPWFLPSKNKKWAFIQEMLIRSWTWLPLLPEHSSDWDSSSLTFHPSGKTFAMKSVFMTGWYFFIRNKKNEYLFKKSWSDPELAYQYSQNILLAEILPL